MGLKDRMKIKQSTGEKSNMGLRNKFKKRNASVLDKMYEEKDERSKGGSLGRRIFDQDKMKEFGVEDFTTEARDVFVEVMPLSFDTSVPYCKELSVHFGVGINNDAYICMNRYSNQKCFRCEKQSIIFRDPTRKDEAVKLYPTDRACYLLWDRSKELVESETPDYTLKLWASPKKNFHGEVQAKVRNKITRTNLDISDLSEGGDGRTLSFTIGVKKSEKGVFPEYKAFELIERDKSIPDKILEKLDAIFTAAEEQGYSNCIDMFLNIHEYDELKEAMESEEEIEEENPPPKKPSVFNKQKQEEPKSEELNTEDFEKSIQDELEEVQQHLESIMNSPLKWKMWLKKNGYSEALDMSPEDAIPAIIDDMYEKKMNDVPF